MNAQKQSENRQVFPLPAKLFMIQMSARAEKGIKFENCPVAKL